MCPQAITMSIRWPILLFCKIPTLVSCKRCTLYIYWICEGWFPPKFCCSFGFCPNYLLLLSSESPQMMIFDVIMSRFPQNYSPQIIYDNACKFKEFGLNREKRRFMQIQITCDRFHESNHTSCGKSFKFSEYIQLLGKNTQACEQVNAKLRMIASTCTFMNADMFMRAITLFLANQNISKTDRWESRSDFLLASKILSQSLLKWIIQATVE